MRRVRWRPIIGGTGIIILLTLVAGEIALRRWQEFDRRAAFHAEERDRARRAERLYLASVRNVSSGVGVEPTHEAVRLRNQAARYAARRAYHSKLESKYHFAETYPLLPVAADPPAPQ